MLLLFRNFMVGKDFPKRKKAFAVGLESTGMNTNSKISPPLVSLAKKMTHHSSLLLFLVQSLNIANLKSFQSKYTFLCCGVSGRALWLSFLTKLHIILPHSLKHLDGKYLSPLWCFLNFISSRWELGEKLLYKFRL